MRYARKLQEGIFLKRYKRFFADIEWQGKEIIAHVANTGSLKSINYPGQACLFSETDNPERKLKYTLEMIRSPYGGAWVGINTALSNPLVKEKLEHTVGHPMELSIYKYWCNFDEIKAEYKVNSETRLDFALISKKHDKMHFIEVKNVSMAEDGVALFPDAVTERGQKHLRELMKLMDQGHTAELLFTVQRHDVGSFSPADHIDPTYGKLLREAFHKGLKITPVLVDLTPEFAELSETQLPLKI